MFHNQPYYTPMNWDIWSMMILGMGLFKLGILTGEKSAGFYSKLTLIGYGIGIPLNSWTAWSIIQSNFDPVHHALLATTYDAGRLTIAMGHLGVIMLLCRATIWNWLTSRLAAVGQMALTNYVMHSVICSFVFTGYGLAMYGRWERHQVYYLVAGIWILQLIVSPLWLARYRFGPVEWLWRSLTYWKRQPLRGVASA
jgi:uncharacterized protein